MEKWSNLGTGVCSCLWVSSSEKTRLRDGEDPQLLVLITIVEEDCKHAKSKESAML